MLDLLKNTFAVRNKVSDPVSTHRPRSMFLSTPIDMYTHLKLEYCHVSKVKRPCCTLPFHGQHKGMSRNCFARL